MTKALAYVAILALILSLGATLITIWLQVPAKDDYLRLTGLLLSWPVIAGGLAIGGGSTFSQEVRQLLNRVATQKPHSGAA